VLTMSDPTRYRPLAIRMTILLPRYEVPIILVT
jgi:hypothetical protein